MFSLFRKDGQNRPDQCLAPEDQLPAECHFVNSGDEAADGAPRPVSDGAAETVLAVQVTDCPPVSGVSSEGSGTAAVDATPTSELADRPSSGQVADQEAEPVCEPHRVPAETASADEATGERDPAAEELAGLSGRQRRRRLKGRRLARPEQATAGRHASFTPEQRLLLLDTWLRSGLPAKDFAALVGISKHTLYKWKQLFEDQGPDGLADPPRTARRGSRLPEVTKRTILMLKQQHPEWGCQRISDLLARGPALPASASAVARVLHEAGYESVQELTRPHPPKSAASSGRGRISCGRRICSRSC